MISADLELECGGGQFVRQYMRFNAIILGNVCTQLGSKLRLIRSPMRLAFSPWRLKIWFSRHFSLRSKRFRLVSEQRNTEEGDFRYGPREK